MSPTKHILLLLLLISSALYTSAQVGFNNPNPDAAALLDLKANDKGLLIPRMTSAQRDAIGLTKLLVMVRIRIDKEIVLSPRVNGWQGRG